MNGLGRRGQRRPAPPSVRLHDDVPWAEPDDVALPGWRKALSGVELVLFVALLGVVLTFAIGVVLVIGFFLLDMLVG